MYLHCYYLILELDFFFDGLRKYTNKQTNKEREKKAFNQINLLIDYYQSFLFYLLIISCNVA